MFVKLSNEYAWIVPSCPLVTSCVTGLAAFIFPKVINRFRRLCAVSNISSLISALLISYLLFRQQVTSHSIQQYLWAWVPQNDTYLELGFLVDPLTLIMSILVTTAGILVMIYSDSYMRYDQGYVRFYAYLSLFTAAMLGLVFSPTLIQIYMFWELVGMSSYLLIGFWFARSTAAVACQKAFITNRIGDFGFLLGILGTYFITGSFEIYELCDRFVKLNSSFIVNPIVANTIVLLLFLGPVAKSAQFPLHVWLPDATEGPTPISALIHAATMVAAGIFLVARIFSLIQTLPFSMSIISWVGGVTALLGATLAFSQKDLKRCLAYSTMSQLGYMVLASGIGTSRSALFHLITHAYSKALLFLGSGSVIHSMEKLVGYSPTKSQNITFMGGLRKFMPITGITFFLGTLSLCGIPPLACFWSKDEIITRTWVASPFLGSLASLTAGFTAFYMFRIYFATFEGNFRANDIFSTTSKETMLYSNNMSLWGDDVSQLLNKDGNNTSPYGKTQEAEHKDLAKVLLVSNFIEKDSTFDNTFQLQVQPDLVHSCLDLPYPEESGFIMTLPLIVFSVPTVLIGLIGVNFTETKTDLDLLSEWLVPITDFLEINKNTENLVGIIKNSLGSLIVSLVGFFISFLVYAQNQFIQTNLTKDFSFLRNSTFIRVIQKWSTNRGYIDYYHDIYIVQTVVCLSKLVLFFDQWIIDGFVNGLGALSFFSAGGMRYAGGSGRISYYIFGLLIGIISLLWICYS
uniref:NAD(P)H-quinone oxidoreductase subunit 5, chloroplastic n=1 Tax=Lindsaea linearis TaxID=641179 RepID=A0A5B9RC07_9MONI|nr:NADH-plastoquinone oxidoreductase subunit 5 [Lindsaea linearis]QEG57394.1 NADH-plastoquinone oxidoreductase subunit 5 [Lindsaea linearis]